MKKKYDKKKYVLEETNQELQAEKSFDECYKRLENIVTILEEGEISLEDSIKLYEEGIELAKICTSKLNEAELKIKKLTKDFNNKINYEDFEINDK